jgi:hypothetical protein
VNQALRAHKLFQRDKDYIVKDDKVVIIDEFTGRMMEGRRYSEGLHQALEAKEGVAIQPENQTLASITFQNYFRLYPKLAGMTGTASTEAEEFGRSTSWRWSRSRPTSRCSGSTTTTRSTARAEVEICRRGGHRRHIKRGLHARGPAGRWSARPRSTSRSAFPKS